MTKITAQEDKIITDFVKKWSNSSNLSEFSPSGEALANLIYRPDNQSQYYMRQQTLNGFKEKGIEYAVSGAEFICVKKPVEVNERYWGEHVTWYKHEYLSRKKLLELGYDFNERAHDNLFARSLVWNKIPQNPEIDKRLLLCIRFAPSVFGTNVYDGKSSDYPYRIDNFGVTSPVSRARLMDLHPERNPIEIECRKARLNLNLMTLVWEIKNPDKAIETLRVLLRNRAKQE